ncbi:hypothetical protein [Rhodococcus opacus]|uniref:hypothetical protein n=1 Tax=Rhodococcus opacus TaxID=37919 RepID=UPI0029493BF1|nr:hypothetical protein [Rhodococcus opacus]MDV6246879.1 hypothetical protein [Rhodococcus opacus]
MKTPAPVLTSHWDNKRQEVTYRVQIEGTSKYLLFTAETLADLQSQINSATKGTNTYDGTSAT